MFVEKVVV